MLWARFGDKVVITTHFCFVNGDGGKQRGLQQLQLAALVARLLDEPYANDGDGHDSANGRVTHVVIAGDFNHCLKSQTIASGKVAAETTTPAVWGVTRSPSMYTSAWLPSHAAVENLLDTLACGGKMRVERLSTDQPTNEDGTVDHIIFVAKESATTATRSSGTGASAAVEQMAVLEDNMCDYSDHLMISASINLR